MLDSCDSLPEDLGETLRVEDVLGLFAKYPEPGKAKSRLAAQTSPEWAAQVAEAFLRDLSKRLERLPVSRFLVYSPAASRQWFTDLAGERYRLHLQVEGDLGKRMAEFLQVRFTCGARKIVLLGMDSPTLPLAYISQAFHLLEDSDVVLGPAVDGGYYLFGCRRFTTAIWERVEWSRATVLAATIHNLRSLGMTYALLPPWYDIDTLEDFQMLLGHLMGLQDVGKSPALPELEGLLAQDRSCGFVPGEKPAVVRLEHR